MNNNTGDPKISIVIPVYNGSNYLKKAIDCALSQTYGNTEVIVVNDGSTDGGETERIALSYGDRIVYFKKENGGVSSALNLGIQKMSGEYFSWLSHDDEFTPDKLESSVRALKDAGKLDGKTAAYCGHSQIGEDSQVLKIYKDDLLPGKYYAPDEMTRYSVSHQALNGCCFLIPAAMLREAGGFDEKLRYSQDALLWLRLFLNGMGLVYDGKINVGYRLHRSQTSRTKHDLFDSDSEYIARAVTADLIAVDSGNRTAYSFAGRNAIYGARKAVNAVKDIAKQQGHPFSFSQRAALDSKLIYSSARSRAKKIYYRSVYKLKS